MFQINQGDMDKKCVQRLCNPGVFCYFSFVYDFTSRL